MAKKTKKKKDIDINQLDPDELLREAVACMVLGRTLASYAGMITGREKTDRDLIYALLRASKKPNANLPVTASIESVKQDNVKKYTPAQAIEWFTQEYPREAQPLLQRLEERHSRTDPVLSYGLKEGESLPDDYLINTLEKMLPIGRGAARALYERVIKPELERQREESGLVTVTMKD